MERATNEDELFRAVNRLALEEEDNRRPFKLVNWTRELRLGLTASSLIDLISRAKVKFDLDPDHFLRVVLEVDGTEIDDNDYFVTLEPDTTLMILVDDEKWTPYRSFLTLGLALEPRDSLSDPDGSVSRSGSNSSPSSPVEELVWRLHQDLSFFPWLTPKELETIAKMDRDEMKKIVPDVKFLEFLQDLCERYLQDKEKEGVTSILNDPIKLIRMYSKSNHYLYTNSFDQNLRRTN